MGLTWRRAAAGVVLVAMAAAAGWAKPKAKGVTAAGAVKSVTATDVAIVDRSGVTMGFTLGDGTSYALLNTADAAALKAGDEVLLVGAGSVPYGQTLSTFAAHAVVATAGANTAVIAGAVALLPPEKHHHKGKAAAALDAAPADPGQAPPATAPAPAPPPPAPGKRVKPKAVHEVVGTVVTMDPFVVRETKSGSNVTVTVAANGIYAKIATGAASDITVGATAAAVISGGKNGGTGEADAVVILKL